MESPIRQWKLGIIFFLLIGLLFIGLFYIAQGAYQRQQSPVPQYKGIRLLFRGGHFPESFREVESSISKQPPEPAGQQVDSSIVLFIGQAKSVGKIKLIYRGSKKKKINIDVIIPELDPKTTYRHSIDETEAKRGFRLSEENFILISSSKSKLQLKKRNNR